MATKPAISMAFGLTDAIRNNAIGVNAASCNAATSARTDRLAKHIARASNATHSAADTRRYARALSFCPATATGTPTTP